MPVDGGLPAGLQLTGRAWQEATLLRLADAFARAAGTEDLAPPEAT